MDIGYMASLAVPMIRGSVYTIALFLSTALFSLPLGFGLTFLRRSKNKLLASFVGFYVWIMRGTPLLLQLFFFYYGMCYIPVIGPYWRVAAFPASCIAFALNYAAYFCEIFRGGLLSIDKGQYEAARVLGFSKWQTTKAIILPQMIKVSLPAVSNECITLVKDTALITAITVTEILHAAKAAVNRDANPVAYLVAALVYLFMNFILTRLFERLEKRFMYE